jgi:hypothetical protein
MKLSTGKIAFPIEFDNGDKQSIFFNPNDPDLMVRMKELGDRVNKKIGEIDDIELSADGKPVGVEQVEIFDMMQCALKEELDYAFGGSVSGVVFKHCSPFAIVDGEYFVVQFIRAVTPEIEKCVKKANADVEKKMAKHIDKYRR